MANMESCEHDTCIVVHEYRYGKKCPLCEATKSIEELESEVETLKDANVELADELKDANTKIDALENAALESSEAQ